MPGSSSNPKQPGSQPRISVIITTYDESRYPDFCECVDSVLDQTYDAFDIVLVTETESARDAVTDMYGSNETITIEHMDDGGNLATARNAGASVADGDVVAFIDDDCIADREWLSELGRGYQTSELAAVGGRTTPLWTTGAAKWLPEEFYWLVGVTHEGFADSEGQVRNTFGCNISFRRDVFLDLGGFNPNLGKDHGHNLQGEETELCARLRSEHDSGVYYVPTAEVQHKVYAEQTSIYWLINRAFWQGVTKSLVEGVSDDATDEDWGFLSYLAQCAVPRYVRKGAQLDVQAIVKLLSIFVFTGAVGIGFMYGKLRS